MKKLIRILLCAGVLAALLSTAALAADSDISIQLNGSPLAFTDAAPKLINNRTYLPFRTVFTALGFEDGSITYDGETRTVSAAKDDLTISMVIDQPGVTVVRDGKTSLLDTDAPALIDPEVSRTYVPARFISEAAGCRVGWDGETRTVFIDDVDALWASNEETYEILERLIAYEYTFQRGDRQVAGSYAASSGDGLEMNGEYSMLTSGSAFEFQGQMAMSGEASSTLPGRLDLEMRGDLKTGDIYLKSGSLTPLSQLGQQDAWFYMNLNEMAGVSALSPDYLDALLGDEPAEGIGKIAAEQTLRTCLDSFPSLSAGEVLTQLNGFLGDSAFTRSEDGYASTLKGPGMEASLVLPVADEKIDGYTLSLAFREQDISFSLTAAVQGDSFTASCQADAGGEPFELTMDGRYAPADRAPNTKPGQDAAVIDASTLFQLP